MPQNKSHKAAFDALYGALNKRDPAALELALYSLKHYGLELSRWNANGFRTASPGIALVNRFGGSKPDACLRCMRLLHDAGADWGAGRNGALADACRCGNLAAARFLTEAGVLPDIEAVEMAILHRRRDILDLFIDTRKPNELKEFGQVLSRAIKGLDPRRRFYLQGQENIDKITQFADQAKAALDAAHIKSAMPEQPQTPETAKQPKPRI